MQPIRIASVLLLCTGFAIAQHSAGTPTAFAAADQPSSASPVEPKAPHSFDVNAIDKSADPCRTSSSTPAATGTRPIPFPPTARWGRFTELGEYNNYLLYKDLVAGRRRAQDAAAEEVRRLLRRLHEHRLIDKLGDKPLLPDLKAIDELTGKKQLPAFNAKQDRRGGGAFFGFAVTQDQKDSTPADRRYRPGWTYRFPTATTTSNDRRAIDEDPRGVRREHGRHLPAARRLAREGRSGSRRTSSTIETALAKGSLDRVAMRDPATRYHPMSVAELKT